jgi:hypothetical protein
LVSTFVVGLWHLEALMGLYFINQTRFPTPNVLNRPVVALVDNLTKITKARLFMGAKLVEKQKLYEGAMQKLREKDNYKQKAVQLTEELKQAWLQLSNVQGCMNNFVMIYEQDDPVQLQRY